MEYIVVDANSTDSTQDVIQRNRPRIDRYISEADRGQADAVNKGIRMSTGQIIGWLNSDDCYLEGAISAAINSFRDPDVVAVYGDYVVIDGSDRILGLRRQPSFDSRIALYAYLTVMQPAAFFTRAAFDAVGGLDETLHYCLDYDFWLRLAKIGRLVHVRKYLAAFRLHEASKTCTDNGYFEREHQIVRKKWLGKDGKDYTERAFRWNRRLQIARLVWLMGKENCLWSRLCPRLEAERVAIGDRTLVWAR